MPNSIKDRLSKIASNVTDLGSTESFMSSGSVVFDAVISEGRGIPSKKFIQITSGSNLGKTTLCLHIAKMACANGKTVLYIDSEKGVNNSQIIGLGLDKYLGDTFLLHQVSTFKEAEECIDAVLDYPSQDLAYVMIDSITDLITEAQIEKSVEDAEVAIDARMISKFLRKYRAKLFTADTNASFIFINQVRVKMNNMMGASIKGSGGNAQEFRMDILLEMRKKEKLKRKISTLEGEKEVAYGSHVYLSAPEKNRYSPPNVEGVLTIIFGKGVSNIVAYQRLLTSKGLLTHKGAGNYVLTLPDKEEMTCRGRDKLEGLIKDNLADIKKWVDSIGGYQLVEKDTF